MDRRARHPGCNIGSMEDVLGNTIDARMRFWEDQLADAVINNDNDRAKECERLIAEYTLLLEVQLEAGAGSGASESAVPSASQDQAHP